MEQRLKYASLSIVTFSLGLLSRTEWIPVFIYPYLGDILYAVLIYLLSAFVFISHSPSKIAIYAFIFCVGIECSQLYHAPWIDTIRTTKIGSLTLGFGFLWTDIIAYFAGIGIDWRVNNYYIKHYNS